jgi:hypothetical protein
MLGNIVKTGARIKQINYNVRMVLLALALIYFHPQYSRVLLFNYANLVGDSHFPDIRDTLYIHINSYHDFF